MALSVANKLGIRFFQETSLRLLAPLVASTDLQSVRYARTKHYNPQFKRLRKLKVIKVDIPKFNEKQDELTEEQVRAKLKERGLLPRRPWMERQFYISCTGGTFEAYVPPEGDGKVSSLTAQGAKQKVQFLEKKTKTMMAIRKIRSFEEDFDTPAFCKLAEEIYIKAHENLLNKDKDELIKYVTERAYPEIYHNIENKTIHWKYLKQVELPRVVHARCTDVVTKENIFAQMTVRFHSQQMLAVYDRFGRLIQGSEIIAKDVLEYVVFEKHLSNEYGIWRIHEKIIPDWVSTHETVKRTFKKVCEDAPVADTAIVGKPNKIESQSSDTNAAIPA